MSDAARHSLYLKWNSTTPDQAALGHCSAWLEQALQLNLLDYQDLTAVHQILNWSAPSAVLAEALVGDFVEVIYAAVAGADDVDFEFQRTQLQHQLLMLQLCVYRRLVPAVCSWSTGEAAWCTDILERTYGVCLPPYGTPVDNVTETLRARCMRLEDSASKIAWHSMLYAWQTALW